MPLAWWLFVRDARSIRIDVTDPLTIVIRGPAERTAEHRFASEFALVQFATDLENQLFVEGWALAGFEAERRLSGDRRRSVRGSVERRMP